MSILLYDFKELTQCISEVERIEARVKNSSKTTVVDEKEEEEREEEDVPVTLDSFLPNK